MRAKPKVHPTDFKEFEIHESYWRMAPRSGKGMGDGSSSPLRGAGWGDGWAAGRGCGEPGGNRYGNSGEYPRNGFPCDRYGRCDDWDNCDSALSITKSGRGQGAIIFAGNTSPLAFK